MGDYYKKYIKYKQKYIEAKSMIGGGLLDGIGNEEDVKKILYNTFNFNFNQNGYSFVTDIQKRNDIINKTYTLLKDSKTWLDYNKNSIMGRMSLKAVLEVLQPDENIRKSILDSVNPPQPTFAELNAERERENELKKQLNKVKIEEEERKKAEEQRRINEAIAKQKKEKEDELNNIRSKNEITQDEYDKLQGHEKKSGQYNSEVRNEYGINIMYYVKNPDYDPIGRIGKR